MLLLFLLLLLSLLGSCFYFSYYDQFVSAELTESSTDAYLTKTKGMITNPARITNTKPGNVSPRVAWYTLLKITAPTSCIIAVTTPYTENREPKG